MRTKRSLSQAFVRKISNMPELQHGAVRIALWLVSAAEQKGGFPVEAFAPSSFIAGLNDDGIRVPGIQFRPETVHKSLESLESCGLLTIETGLLVRGGRTAKLFTLHLD